MSFDLKKNIMSSLTPENTGLLSALRQGCSMIKPEACNTYDPYCKIAPMSGMCGKKIKGSSADDAFYDKIHMDDLNIPFISPEFIFTFDKELSDVLLMEHARMYVEDREEYDRLMSTTAWKRSARNSHTLSDLKPKEYDQKLQEAVRLYKPHVARVIEAPKQAEKVKASKYKCGDIRPERCHKYKTHCVQDSHGEFIGEEIDEKTNETLYVYKNKRGTLSSWPYSRLNNCRKIVNGLVLDQNFEKTIDPEDLLQNKPKRVSKKSTYNPMLIYGEPADLGPLPTPRSNAASAAASAAASNNFNSPPRPKSFIQEASVASSSQPDLTSLSEIHVSPVVEASAAHLSKSGCDNAGTEAAVVAEIQEVPSLSRAQSIELIKSPAVQHYLELHGHLSRAEFLEAKELLNAMYEQIKKIISSSDSKKVKQGKISDILNSVDLCKYIRNGPKNTCLSVSELKKKITAEAQLSKILEAFSGNVENAHIYGLRIRSAMCYIILSVVLMTPEEFVSRLTEFK